MWFEWKDEFFSGYLRYLEQPSLLAALVLSVLAESLGEVIWGWKRSESEKIRNTIFLPGSFQ